MTPGVRKLALTAHVGSSVGWIGAVSAFLVLSIAGLSSHDGGVVRSAYVAMNLIGQYAIVPLSVAALVTGLVVALGTQWGLVRHYWVLSKFALTVVATLLLLLHQFTAVAGAARLAAGGDARMPEIGDLGTQLVFDAGAAMVVLLGALMLSVYKPWGLTRWGRRAVDGASLATVTLERQPIARGLRFLLAAIGLIMAIVAIVHIAGGGMGRH